MRAVGKIEDRDDPEDDRRDAFEDKDPLPSRPAVPINTLHNQTRHRRAYQLRHRDGRHEHSDGLCAVFITIPVGQINDNSREESRLGQTEQKAHRIKFPFGRNKPHPDGEDSPGNHDSRDPFARAPSLDNQSARDFEQEVADEEDSRAEAEDRFAERQVFFHPKLCESDVDPVNESNDVKSEQIGDDMK
jgi:hypothetical protein